MSNEEHAAVGIMAVIPDGWLTQSAVAKIVNRHPDTISTWRKQGVYRPSGYVLAGQTRVWLYSPEDVRAMRDIAKVRKAGRPRKIKEDA